MKAKDLGNLFEEYIKEYDNWIDEGNLTRAAEVLYLIEEAKEAFKLNTTVINEVKIH